MPLFRVSPAKPEDAPILTEIAFAAKRHWGYPESWIMEWTESLTISPAFVREHPTLMAANERQILGVAAICVNGTVASLLHLWVRPTAMGQGVGAALFAACETAAREAGATRLTVESDPNAEGFYHKMGARLIGQVPAGVLGSERSLPLLEKTLV